MIEAIVTARLQEREGRNVEFKAAASNFDKEKLAKYCVALGNEGGGSLLLGVTDDRQVSGTTVFRDLNAVELYLHEVLALNVRAHECHLEQGRVLLFEVPPRLPGVPLEFKGQYLKRAGESLVAMGAVELRAIFAESTDPEEFFHQPAAGFDQVEVADLEKYLDVEAFFTLSQTEMGTHSVQWAAVLENYGLIAAAANRPGTYAITNLGALVLAHDLRKFPKLADRRLRFVRYRGKNRVDSIEDRTYNAGYGVAFSECVSDVNRAVPREERIGSSLRDVVPLYLPVAVREIVANAIVHQDFQARARLILVELYDDRLEVTNPGAPQQSVKEFARASQPRNHRFSMLMKELRICEARGSGIQRILLANEQEGRSDPEFVDVSGTTVARLVGVQNFLDMASGDRSWAILMHATFRYVSNEAMTNATFRDRYRIPESKKQIVTNSIGIAIGDGYIKPIDKKQTRYAKYHPIWA